ncbi:hypothetical protein GWO43_18815 [candidate division KSB1 bacterium]|nr:hypothetical protein [Phycisphaerae bacterium]NIR50596.1 hypothetical protein [candidate division KSB1 bacterium]NIS26091.1 hypothetical protein [candidate division KSB1 bacterium]NIT72887.1 hypothetical protein [candidate division KSB1 bacterium]NIU26730.1 hypothetical protein [candidate division KSB1 bacterium]
MPGLINNRSGMYLDDATHYAWELGYICSQTRPHIEELLELIEMDLFGDYVTSANDAQEAEAFYSAEECRHELDRLGILGRNETQMKQVESAINQWKEQLNEKTLQRRIF